MLFRNRYEYDPKTDLIANGSAAKIYKATDTHNGRAVAIKFYHTLGIEPERFKSNMQKALQLQAHPSLVRLYDYFEIENINHFGEVQYIRVGIWEYVSPSEHDFAEHLNKAPLATANEILDALQYLHDNECRHFALQRKNILMNENGDLKLNNYQVFDDGTYQGDTDAKLNLAQRYRSPEYYMPKEYGLENGSGTNHDLWSLGCLLHQICLGRMPFGIDDAEVSTVKDLSYRIGSQRELQIPDDLNEPFATLIEKCLVRHATYRVSSPGELKEILLVTDRKYRFDAVMPLSEEQFLSRYRFDDELSKIDESKTFETYDNLINEFVSLQIFAGKPDMAFFDTPNAKVTHYFKAEIADPSGNMQTYVIGLLSNTQSNKEEQQINVFSQNESGYVADDATPSSGITFDKRDQTPPTPEPELEESTPSFSNQPPEVEKRPETEVPTFIREQPEELTPPQNDKLKATEIIRREALERVKRDMEKLMSDKDRD